MGMDFLSKLKYVNDAYTGKTYFKNEDGTRKEYSDEAHTIFSNLVAWIQECNFTNKKSSKFICKHCFEDNKTLIKLYEQETGKQKTYNGMTAQRAETCHILNQLLPFDGDWTDWFLDDEDEIDNLRMLNSLIEAYKLGTLNFDSAFVSEVTNRLFGKEQSKKKYDLSELDEEIKLLNSCKLLYISKRLEEIDLDKLLYIKSVINAPISISGEINTEKMNLLNRFNFNNTTDNYELPKMKLSKTMGELQVKLLREMIKNNTDERVDRKKVEEAKKILYTFSLEGMQRYLEPFSKGELVTAMKELQAQTEQ